MSYTHNGRLYTDDGSLNTLFWGSVVSRPLKAGGFASDASGNVYIEHDSPGPLTRHDGICTTADGALFVTTDAPSVGNYRHNGIRFRADGAMHVTSGGPAAGDTMHNGWRISAAGQAYVTSSFQAKFADLGSGAVDTTTIFSVGSGTPTFTRATAAASKISTGLWKLDVASGTARSSYLGMNTAVGAYGGYLAEGARTNLCLQSRDLSNASWTKVNTTGAKDQTGIDGVANSASSLTATLGGGTCLQTITEAATDSTFSMFIKRITGTGTITIQQGASTSEISAQVNSTTYTQVSLDATVLNPVIGIVLGTNGDKIAVDCVQFENGAFASTPIPTTTVAVTRNADVLTYPVSGNANSPAGTCYAEILTLALSSAGLGLSFVTAAQAACYFRNTGTGAIGIFDGTTQCLTVNTATANTINKVATSYGGAGLSSVLAGGAPAVTAFDGSMNLGANFAIGIDIAGVVNALFGTLKNVRLNSRQIPDGILQQITT